MNRSSYRLQARSGERPSGVPISLVTAHSLSGAPSRRARSAARTVWIAGALAGITVAALAVALIAAHGHGAAEATASSATSSTLASSSVAAEPPGTLPAATESSSRAFTQGSSQPDRSPALASPTSPPGPAAAGGLHASARAPAHGSSRVAALASGGAGSDGSSNSAAAGGSGTAQGDSAGDPMTAGAPAAGPVTLSGPPGTAARAAALSTQGCQACGTVLSVTMARRGASVGYVVRVQLPDGTQRTLRQAHAPSVGSRIDVAAGTH